MNSTLMETKPSGDSEWAYWDREISREELEALFEQGRKYLDWPRVLEHRVQFILWNKRIKIKYRQRV